MGCWHVLVVSTRGPLRLEGEGLPPHLGTHRGLQGGLLLCEMGLPGVTGHGLATVPRGPPGLASRGRRRAGWALGLTDRAPPLRLGTCPT